MIRLKKIALCLSFLLLFSLTGCQSDESVSLKREKPKPKAVSIGFSSVTEETPQGVNVVYLGIGLDKDEKITYLSINRNEFNENTNILSVKEQGDSYGLSFESHKGDWKTQMEAFENYAVGKAMTIDELRQTELDENGIPAEESDLFAACEIDLRLPMAALAQVEDNMYDVNAYYPAITQDVVRTNTGFDFSIMLNVKNEYDKVIYVEIDQYSIEGNRAEQKNEEMLNALETKLQGLTCYEIARIETYDTGDGIHNSLPLKNSFLSDISMNLNFLKQMYKKIGG